MATGHFEVKNEILFLNLETAHWQKNSRVYVEDKDDMPSPRMGASLVSYGDRLYVYSGADPYGSSSTSASNIYSDFYSFNRQKGYWKKEKDFAELKNADGSMLGQALRMYNSGAVIFSGGCNTATQTCSFGVTKSILFE